MKIYLASGNVNKKREMSEIFPNHTIITPKDQGISFNPVENGKTFYENSIIKAKALYDITLSPVIADDSGICVDALDGGPGIYSSRYGGPDFMQGRPDGEKTSQEDQNRMLIEQVNAVLKSGIDTSINKSQGLFPNGPRSCRYVCAMVLYLGPSRIFVAQETMEGILIDKIEDARGTGGFGYDPLFLIPGLGKTAAELTPEQKNSISHRGRAARVIQGMVKNISDFDEREGDK